MIKKISLGVFYGFLGLSFLKFLQSVFFNHIDLNTIIAALSIRRIIIIVVSGFFIGAFIEGIIDGEEERTVEIRSKRARYFFLLGTLIAFVISVFF